MEELITSLVQYGALGVVAGVSLWKSFSITDRLLDTINRNTSALIELTVLIKQMNK